MSTIRANTIQDASGGSNAVLYGVASPANSMGFRNRIINGDMRIDQRNNGASVTGVNGNYTLDRWVPALTGGGGFSVQRSTTAPAGFTNSLFLTVTTADSSLASGDYYGIQQFIEGYNVADFAYGTTSAVPVTLSFWVRSSITGTYGVWFGNSNAGKSYVGTYTINAANTWEQKTITVSGDTAAALATDNSSGLRLWFTLGGGSSFTTTAGSWQSGSYFQTSAQAQWISTNGATFYITGVQLEAGSVATPFERRDYGRELMMCQRYFEKSFPQSTAVGTATINGIHQSTASTSFILASGTPRLQTAKRASPTVTLYSTNSNNTTGVVTEYNTGGVFVADRSANVVTAAEASFWVQTAGTATVGNDIRFNWTASAEL